MSEEKDKRVFDCTKPIADLLGEGEFKKAFELLDQYIEQSGLVDSLSFLAVMKLQFINAERAISLSTISWDQYKIDNSKVVVSTIYFTQKLCKHITTLGLVDKYLRNNYKSGDLVGSSEVIDSFEALLDEINSLEPKKPDAD